jgi:hypothetical protein
MSGTETVPDTSSGELARLGIPNPVVSIRVDGIRTFRTYDDDDGLILLITDGDATVEFLCGFSGRSPAAALGAQRLAEATRAYSLVIEAAEDGIDGPAPGGEHS